MKVLNLSESNFKDCVKRAADILRSDGTIIYPTDTLYGLGADAFSDTAVQKIYKIKGREENKPIPAIVSDLRMAEGYALFDDKAYKLASKFWPGALTLVLRCKSGTGTMGLRIPKSKFCIALVSEFGKPITATSANKSNERPEQSVARMPKELLEMVDLVIDSGELSESMPSTVVDTTSEEPVILREGAISRVEVLSALSKSH